MERLDVGLHESNMLNSYNRLYNRLVQQENVCITMQPVVQPVVQPAVSCIQTFSWLYNRLYSQLYNGLHRVYGVLLKDQIIICNVFGSY